MVDNLLPDHVGLPPVLDLAVHLVQLTTWMGRWGLGSRKLHDIKISFGKYTPALHIDVLECSI